MDWGRQGLGEGKEDRLGQAEKKTRTEETNCDETGSPADKAQNQEETNCDQTPWGAT